MSTSSKGAEWREAGKTKVLSAGATLGFNFELVVVFTAKNSPGYHEEGSKGQLNN